jgi:hypothetical protein
MDFIERFISLETLNRQGRDKKMRFSLGESARVYLLNGVRGLIDLFELITEVFIENTGGSAGLGFSFAFAEHYFL